MVNTEASHRPENVSLAADDFRSSTSGTGVNRHDAEQTRALLLKAGLTKAEARNGQMMSSQPRVTGQAEEWPCDAFFSFLFLVFFLGVTSAVRLSHNNQFPCVAPGQRAGTTSLEP
jgi:hypothetical protein